MASKSLGTLTLDLVAKTGGFVKGMDAAERKSAKWRKQVDKDMQAAGKAIGAASAIAVGAMAVWIKSSINTAAEIQNLAKIANTSTTDFQRFAAGSRTVGIENEKLSDILKDVTDRVGDFLVTGGGPMADFFEKVAPMVGVTAEQFRNLSGADALGLYVDTLEKAGANQQEMTFFMEAMASDASALIPLLKNGGKEMKGLADEASELGLVLSEETIKQAKQFNDDLDMLGRVASGVGQQIAGELLPELLNLTDELRDPETAKAAADMAKAIVGAFTSIIEAGRETVQFMQWVGEELAFQMTGIAATDDIIRMERELENLQNQFGDLESVKFSPEWINAITGVNDDLTAAQQRARFLREEIAGFYNAPPVKIEVELETDTDTGGGLGLNLPSKEDEEKIKAAAKAAEKAAKEAQAARKAAAKAAADSLEAIEKEITAIERAAKVWGMEAHEVQLYDLAQQGATETQLAYAESVLETVEGFEKAKEAQDNYLQLVKDLRTDEERLTDQLHERLAVLDAIADLNDEERNKSISRIIDAGFAEAPSYAGLDATIGGPAGELDKLDDAQEKLQEWYDTQLSMLDEFRSERADLAAQWDEQEIALQQEHQERLAEIERARQLTQLAAGEEFFGNMAGAAKAFFGENSKLYQAAFAMEKGYAIAKALMNVPKSYSDAFAAVVGIPVVGPALAPAAGVAAAAAQVAQAAAIGNISLGQAHEGLDMVPETGPYTLLRGERVTTAETSAKLDATLDRVSRSMASGGGSGSAGGPGNIEIHHHVNGSIDNRTSAQIASNTAREQRRVQARFGK